MRNQLRITTGEIAMAHRGSGNRLGVPQVTNNPADHLRVSPSNDVVVLTRVDSRLTYVEMDGGRE